MFANEIIVIFLFPLHAGLHRLYHLFTTVIHNGERASAFPWRVHTNMLKLHIYIFCSNVSYVSYNVYVHTLYIWCIINGMYQTSVLSISSLGKESVYSP